jgi:hypothetical protein
MTSRFTLVYCGLFLFSQVLGILFGLLGFFAPRDFLAFGFSRGLWAFGWILLFASGYMLLHIWRKELHRALYALPAYHLFGIFAMEMYTGNLTNALTRDYGVGEIAAQIAVLQDPGLLFIGFAHSLIGLVGGVYLMVLVKLDEASVI